MKFGAILGLLAVLLGMGPCQSSSHQGNATPVDTLTVEGHAAMRGHEPFAQPVLQTDQDSLYVLALSEVQLDSLQGALPGRLRVRGTAYRDEWYGKSTAHLRVTSWQILAEE